MTTVEKQREQEKLREFVLRKVIPSKSFHPQPAPKLDEALLGFVGEYPGPPSSAFLATLTDGQIHRVKTQLEHCFTTDRSLWRGPDQYLLSLPSGYEGLRLGRLSTAIQDGPSRFWFHHLAHHGERETFFAFSEPLFYFSQSLNAYIRFLDIDHDNTRESEVEELASKAGAKFRQWLESRQIDSESAQRVVDALKLAPVRLYAPAGDAFGISWIRRWFRDYQKLRPPVRKESQRVAMGDYNTSNFIALVSRPTNPALQYLRERCPHLKCDVTKNGVRMNGKELADDVGSYGATRAHVVVTNWIFETGNVCTIIASNHTRATGRVAQMLADDKKPIDPSDLVEKNLIPARLQLVYAVELNLHEGYASDPELIEGGRFVYPAPSRGAAVP